LTPSRDRKGADLIGSVSFNIWQIFSDGNYGGKHCDEAGDEPAEAAAAVGTGEQDQPTAMCQCMKTAKPLLNVLHGRSQGS